MFADDGEVTLFAGRLLVYFIVNTTNSLDPRSIASSHVVSQFKLDMLGQEPAKSANRYRLGLTNTSSSTSHRCTHACISLAVSMLHIKHFGHTFLIDRKVRGSFCNATILSFCDFTDVHALEGHTALKQPSYKTSTHYCHHQLHRLQLRPCTVRSDTRSSSRHVYRFISLQKSIKNCACRSPPICSDMAN